MWTTNQILNLFRHKIVVTSGTHAVATLTGAVVAGYLTKKKLEKQYADLATKMARLAFVLDHYADRLDQFLVVTLRAVRVRAKQS